MSRIYAAITLQHTRRKLERYFHDRGMIRKITVVPGMLDLECIGPIAPRTTTITGTNTTTGDVTVIKSMSTASDWSGSVLFLPPTIQLDQSSDALLAFTLQFGARWNYYSIDVQLRDWKINRVG